MHRLNIHVSRNWEKDAKIFKKDNKDIFRSFYHIQPTLMKDLKEELKNAIEVYIETRLKFPTEKTILEAIDIKLDCGVISYRTYHFPSL